MTDLQKQLTACLITRAILDNAGFTSKYAEKVNEFWSSSIGEVPTGESLINGFEALKACERFCTYNGLRFTDEDLLDRMRSDEICVVEEL